MVAILSDSLSTSSVEAGIGSAMLVLLGCSYNESINLAEVGNESGMLASRVVAVLKVG